MWISARKRKPSVGHLSQCSLRLQNVECSVHFTTTTTVALSNAAVTDGESTTWWEHDDRAQGSAYLETNTQIFDANVSADASPKRREDSIPGRESGATVEKVLHSWQLYLRRIITELTETVHRNYTWQYLYPQRLGGRKWTLVCRMSRHLPTRHLSLCRWTQVNPQTA